MTRRAGEGVDVDRRLGPRPVEDRHQLDARREPPVVVSGQRKALTLSLRPDEGLKLSRGALLPHQAGHLIEHNSRDAGVVALRVRQPGQVRVGHRPGGPRRDRSSRHERPFFGHRATWRRICLSGAALPTLGHRPNAGRGPPSRRLGCPRAPPLILAPAEAQRDECNRRGGQRPLAEDGRQSGRTTEPRHAAALQRLAR